MRREMNESVDSDAFVIPEQQVGEGRRDLAVGAQARRWCPAFRERSTCSPAM